MGGTMGYTRLFSILHPVDIKGNTHPNPTNITGSSRVIVAYIT